MGSIIFFLLFIITIQKSLTIDMMPCTEGVNAATMALAQRLLEDSTPPGYRLLEAEPLSQTGRNPHRWLGRFERIDNVYNHNCDYLTEVRTAFRRVCPPGSEISQIGVVDNPNRKCILVQFLVNCGCRKNSRRRRRYVTEKSTCSGIH